MFIVDAHQDIAYNYLSLGRDYRQSALEHRQREAGSAPPAVLGLPDAMLGRVALIFSTLFVLPRRRDALPIALRNTEAYDYATPAEAHQKALAQLDYYNRLADEEPRLRLVRNQSELDAVLATWAEDAPLEKRVQGLVILMEGADPIREPAEFAEWYERGVRIVGPAWSGTRYAGGTGAPGGLTALGHELLEQMAGHNALLDLSHLAEQAYYEAIDRYEGPIIASHSNPRKFVDTDRHLSDEMIRLLAERDGVMGIVFYNRFLSQRWGDQSRKADVPLSVALDAIDYVCQVTGSARHVGIGTDFDGGFGSESIPDGLDTVMDLWKLREALAGRGYSEADVEAILSGNMLRQLRAALP